MNDEDISEELELTNTVNIQMMIPRRIDEFYVVKKLYESPAGVVIEATSKKYQNGEEKLAIKCVPVNYFNPKLPEILFNLHHPNILHPYEVFHYPDINTRFYGIVMPYFKLDLYEYFYQQKKVQPFDEFTICLIMKEALETVNYVHSQGICHCDLKLDNFLIAKKKYRPKPILIDFDYSLQFPENVLVQASARGTNYYAAPELLKDNSFQFKDIAIFSNKIDTWSLGIMLAYMIVGDPPLRGQNNAQTLALIKQGFVPKDPRFAKVSEMCRDLLSYMLCPDINKRITVGQALTHPWFTVFLKNYIDQHPEVMSEEDYIEVPLMNEEVEI